MAQMIGYCGLDCAACDAYQATVDDDWALREQIASKWAALNQTPILPEHINCEGCRMDGVKTVYCESMCAVRQCALQKGVTTCGDCADMATCQTVGAIFDNCPEAEVRLQADKGGTL